MSRNVCRCGHLPFLHYSQRYACGLGYDWRNWTEDGPRFDAHRAQPHLCDCQRFRPARWTDQHSPWRHLVVRLWWALSDDQRYTLCNLYDRLTRERLCWCDIIDAALHATEDRRSDYQGGEWGCACDAPLPWDAGKPRPGCYCGHYRQGAES